MMKFMFMIFFMIFIMGNKMLLMNLMFLMVYFLIFSLGSNEFYYLISYYFGMDLYSLVLVILSVWIVGLMFMSLEMNFKDKNMVFLMILMIIMMFFLSMNLLMFYFFFEVSLIPMFMLIIYWGVNPERLSAGYFLMMYTLFFSFPLFFYIIQMYKINMSLNFNILIFEEIKISNIEYVMLMGALFIKMPLYLFHVWLPKAHVEAPVYGSMILAAVLLKLGSYGLIRFMMIMNSKMMKMNYVIISISLVGAMVISLVCMNQVDMKMLVAYSSVVHMNFMNSVMLIMNKISMYSSLMMMIAHGLCSSGLFFMVTLFYNNSSSRLIILNKGMLNFMMSFMLGWFYLCMANFSFPMSINFFSEILMMMMLMSWEFKLMVILMMISFFSSVYSLMLYSLVLHGESKLIKMINVKLKEMMIMLIHCYPMVLWMINMIIFY